MKIFEELTKMISTEGNNIGFIIPSINLLKSFLNSEKEKLDHEKSINNKCLSNLIDEIMNQIDHYFGG